MKEAMLRFVNDLGGVGLAAAALLAAVAVFQLNVLRPLEARDAAIKERLSRETASSQAAQPSTVVDKVTAVYAHLRSGRSTTDWLARLHAIGASSGLELRSAAYRSQPTEGRIVRYEIVLPVGGSYPQIRAFLDRSLAEIPVMSIDQLTLRRDSADDTAVQGELRITLHLVNS